MYLLVEMWLLVAVTRQILLRADSKVETVENNTGAPKKRGTATVEGSVGIGGGSWNLNLLRYKPFG